MYRISYYFNGFEWLFEYAVNGKINHTHLRPAITFPGFRIPLIIVVVLVGQFLMLLAEAFVRQVGTAGKGTRSFWFVWHWCSPP